MFLKINMRNVEKYRYCVKNYTEWTLNVINIRTAIITVLIWLFFFLF